MGTIILKKSVDKKPLRRVPSRFISTAEEFSTSFLNSKDTHGMMSAGLTEHRSGSFDWVYKYDELIYMVDGDLTWKDLDTGRSYTFTKGDLGYVEKGTRIRNSTKHGGRLIFCTVPPYENAR